MKLSELKSNQTDKEKILAWLASICAPQDEVDEVIELCRNDKDCRAYYVKKYMEML